MDVKAIAKNIYWSAYGKTICNPPLPDTIKSILFICLGNICRSPFAEKFSALIYRDPGVFHFSSAGIQGEFLRSSPVEAIEAAKYYKVDLIGHLSRRLDKTMMEYFDVILVMDVWQYIYMNRVHPGVRNKIFLLPLFGDNPIVPNDKYNLYNIKDPYGKSLSEFSECYKKIVNCLYGFMKGIKH